MSKPRNLRERILKAAEEKAREAARKFYHCKNKYAFMRERKLVARWRVLVERLKRVSPELFESKRKTDKSQRWLELVGSLLGPRFR